MASSPQGAGSISASPTFSAPVSEVYLDQEEEHWWYRGRRRILLRLMDRFLGPGRKDLLDIGCGSGFMLPFLTRYGRARGIEADPGLVHHARERGLEVDRMEFPNEIPPGRYDVVTLFDVLEHLPDDRSALDGVRKLLRPGGRVIISVPALPWLWSSHDVAVGHHRRYTPSLLGRRLREAGFRILHVTHFNTVLLPLAVLRRLFVLRSGHDLERPPRPANELMAVLLGAESSFAAGAGFRIGVSLGAVAVMPEA